MVVSILSWLSEIIIHIISISGYIGIFFLMALESACVPIPSEIIMPFAGFLVWQGDLILWQIVVWGAFGNLFGSILAYWAGALGGRKLIKKFGKYILISDHDLEMADNWFKKYGQGAVFLGRVLPVVRTFISLPAGIAKMNFWKFSIFTFIGSLAWSFVLAYAGLIMGENWEILKIYFHKFDYIIMFAFLILACWWIKNHFVKKEEIAKI